VLIPVVPLTMRSEKLAVIVHYFDAHFGVISPEKNKNRNGLTRMRRVGSKQGFIAGRMNPTSSSGVDEGLKGEEHAKERKDVVNE